MKLYLFNPVQFVLLLLVLSVTGQPAVSHASEPAIGRVLLVKGVVTAFTEEGQLRTLDKGSEVFKKDTIETAGDSFIVMKMNDDTKLTMRPNSEMKLDEFDQTEGEEKAIFNLLKGGLRTVTGAIGSKKPEAFKVSTSVATIGVRGTDYYTRICAKDCPPEELSLSQFDRVPSAPVGGNGSTKQKKLYELDINNEIKGENAVDCKPVGEIEEALYTAVLDGKIYIRRGDKQLDLEAIEAAFVNEKEIICLSEIPNFIMHDDYLSGNPEDDFTLYNFLEFINDEQQRCEVPGA